MEEIVVTSSRVTFDFVIGHRKLTFLECSGLREQPWEESLAVLSCIWTKTDCVRSFWSVNCTQLMGNQNEFHPSPQISPNKMMTITLFHDWYHKDKQKRPGLQLFQDFFWVNNCKIEIVVEGKNIKYSSWRANDMPMAYFAQPVY